MIDGRRPSPRSAPDDMRGRGAGLPALASVRILSDGRAGHEAQALGIAAALGLHAEVRRIAPRPFYAFFAPFGPPDPRDVSVVAPPWPDIVIAAGRRTIPYLRKLRRLSGRRVFTVYLNRPATGPGTADVIVAPRHDGFFAANVVAPITPANRLTPQLLAHLRRAGDPRLADLPRPRVALLVGGDSRHFRYSRASAAALAELAAGLVAQGAGVMATLSRRTPVRVAVALHAALEGAPAFLWDGSGDGDNPYPAMLAEADHIIVTADSVNMVGEAVATGAPVQVFAPSGGSRKIAAYLEALEKHGAVRPWSGALENWSYPPLNSTPMIADAITTAYARFRRTGGRGMSLRRSQE